MCNRSGIAYMPRGGRSPRSSARWSTASTSEGVSGEVLAEVHKAVQCPLPGAQMIGGRLASHDWFQAGVFAVGPGSALLKPAGTEEIPAISETAERIVTQIAQIRAHL